MFYYTKDHVLDSHAEYIRMERTRSPIWVGV